MSHDGEALVLAQKRIAELEAELVAQTQGARRTIEDLEGQIASARINDADLKGQLERSAAMTKDVLRQLEAARLEKLHLVERLEKAAGAPRGFWARLFSRSTQMDPIPPQMARARRRVSRRFLRGSGLEIGALHSPMHVKRGVQVCYVDRLSTAELRREYAEWSHAAFVEVDLIDDGEILAKVADASQDFVIASHMLEHCENPIGTLRRHLSKLKPGGRLLYIVPDRRGGFDSERPLTTFEHVVRDDQEGPEGSRWEHYLEFSQLANRSPEDQVESIARQMMEAHASIHFHVWEDSTFRDFLEGAAAMLDASFEIVHFELNHAEVISVLEKS